jgi:hypothetical protein
MSIISQSITGTRDAFLRAYAYGLIAYAETDLEFAQGLAAQVQSLRFGLAEEPAEIINLTTELIPTDRDHAVSVARWLLGEVKERKATPGTEAVLAEWACEFIAPRDQIIGIVGIAIMGPTLGILDNKKKKKKSQLQVVIDGEYYEKTSKSVLAAQCMEWGQQLIAKELRLVGGNVYRLHPDSAEWVLAEPVTGLYTESSERLQEQFAAARAEELSVAGYRDENEALIALAVSPSVNDTFVDESEAARIELV